MPWNACGYAPRLDAIRTKPYRFRYCCRQPTITPCPFVSCRCKFYSSRRHATIMPRGFAPPNKPQVGCTRLPAVRLIAKCADMFPLVSDYTHVCFLLDLLLQLLLKLLLLSRSAHSHAVRLRILYPLHTARVPTIELPSRGFSCCCTSQPPQGCHPPCVQLRLHHRKSPTMVVQQPSLQHLRREAIVPHRTPLVHRARMLVFIPTSSSRAKPCSNILAHEAAPEPTFRVR